MPDLKPYPDEDDLKPYPDAEFRHHIWANFPDDDVVRMLDTYEARFTEAEVREAMSKAVFDSDFTTILQRIKNMAQALRQGIAGDMAQRAEKLPVAAAS